MLDDGRLTDGQGRTVSFSNRVIIMTSNLGAEHLLAALSGHTTVKTQERMSCKKYAHAFLDSVYASFSYNFITKLAAVL